MKKIEDKNEEWLTETDFKTFPGRARPARLLEGRPVPQNIRQGGSIVANKFHPCPERCLRINRGPERPVGPTTEAAERVGIRRLNVSSEDSRSLPDLLSPNTHYFPRRAGKARLVHLFPNSVTRTTRERARAELRARP